MNLAETHNKEGYFSPTEFEAMKRIESEEKKARSCLLYTSDAADE